jgi:hypothetical protein
MDKYLEREEDMLTEQLNRGHITDQEYNRLMRELHRDYADQARDAAREAAEEAYARELDRW